MTGRDADDPARADERRTDGTGPSGAPPGGRAGRAAGEGRP